MSPSIAISVPNAEAAAAGGAAAPGGAGPGGRGGARLRGFGEALEKAAAPAGPEAGVAAGQVPPPAAPTPAYPAAAGSASPLRGQALAARSAPPGALPPGGALPALQVARGAAAGGGLPGQPGKALAGGAVPGAAAGPAPGFVAAAAGTKAGGGSEAAAARAAGLAADAGGVEDAAGAADIRQGPARAPDSRRLPGPVGGPVGGRMETMAGEPGELAARLRQVPGAPGADVSPLPARSLPGAAPGHGAEGGAVASLPGVVPASPGEGGQGSGGAAAARTSVPMPAYTVPGQVGSPHWDEALAARITWMRGQQIGTARLQLSPAHLGPVEVRLHMSDDGAAVSFLAHNAHAREALEAAVPRLREMFAGAGLELRHAQVADPGTGHTQTGLAGGGGGSGQGGASGTAGTPAPDPGTPRPGEEEPRHLRIAAPGLVDCFA